MSDIRLLQESDGTWDIVIEDGSIAAEEGFDTAIDVSLFTDARASDDKVEKPEHRRGWMGDIESPVPDRQFGSLLWLLNQRRLTQNTINEAITYARDALNWFVVDGIAKRVEVTGVIVPRSGITLTIIITAPDGQTETHYRDLWEVTGVAN
jgi:phage gp46-like protein